MDEKTRIELAKVLLKICDLLDKTIDLAVDAYAEKVEGHE